MKEREGNETQIEITTYTGTGLAGFQAICPDCGLKMTETIETNLQLDVAAHIAYHAKRKVT